MLRRPARLLAPLALVACVGAVVAVVTGSGPSGTGKAKPSAAPAHHRLHHHYTVKPGDSLSSIAERYGVPTTQLLQLNPGLNSYALRPGQHLTLRR